MQLRNTVSRRPTEFIKLFFFVSFYQVFMENFHETFITVIFLFLLFITFLFFKHMLSQSKDISNVKLNFDLALVNVSNAEM
jgi:hypothetical protein